jgi:hypothetical protein
MFYVLQIYHHQQPPTCMLTLLQGARFGKSAVWRRRGRQADRKSRRRSEVGTRAREWLSSFSSEPERTEAARRWLTAGCHEPGAAAALCDCANEIRRAGEDEPPRRRDSAAAARRSTSSCLNSFARGYAFARRIWGVAAATWRP